MIGAKIARTPSVKPPHFPRAISKEVFPISNTEAELKLRLADPACLKNLLNAHLLQELLSQPAYCQLLETTYYDTADQRLLKSRLSYRLRSADGKWTATVKADGTSDGGLHQRTEYNLSVDNPLPSLEPFMTTAIGPRLAAAVQNMPLEPIFRTRFNRHIMNLTAPDGSEIELALDDGDISAGNKQQQLLELELELKAGKPRALIWLGAALAKDFPLLPEQNSKLYRATVLAGLADGLGQDSPLPCPLKKSTAVLPADQLLSQLLIYHIHTTIRAQQTYLSTPDQSATLNQFRVALSKLHALLELSEPLLPGEDYSSYVTSLSAWQEKLDYIHALARFCLGWTESMRSMSNVLANKAGKPALIPLVDNKLQVTKAAFFTEIATGQCTPVFLGLWSIIEHWSANISTTPVSCKKFVRERLADWLAHLLQQGDNLDPANEEAAHSLYLAGERLRCALDSLAPALPGNTGVLYRRLEQLQDALGKILDTAFTLSLLQELVKASASRLTHHDSGLITGWHLARSATTLENWDRTWSKIRKAAYKVKKLRPLEDEAIYRRSPEL
ncbi:CYTH and CHAD domain-containing protein [Sporomusa acidovorans]|uniref:CYTH domain-containing protein n=1 Tax=Sporomusa acidovorans (strain ATCC 49682 / DSM 3132 / Mol) TaxID=1123286 RepID=A0ABZ3IWD1_SPOA4|nr:CYTH and CHAD domain-containing protein [Sporomusa acidovorans]OZC23673.1 inorganic triphosphatase [Sporomusa acidovorans DSM 3132]SDE24750.1 CHAD domain-containing protein [Sporomusa acidovorans]